MDAFDIADRLSGFCQLIIRIDQHRKVTVDTFFFKVGKCEETYKFLAVAASNPSKVLLGFTDVVIEPKRFL